MRSAVPFRDIKIGEQFQIQNQISPACAFKKESEYTASYLHITDIPFSDNDPVYRYPDQTDITENPDSLSSSHTVTRLTHKTRPNLSIEVNETPEGFILTGTSEYGTTLSIHYTPSGFVDKTLSRMSQETPMTIIDNRKLVDKLREYIDVLDDYLWALFPDDLMDNARKEVRSRAVQLWVKEHQFLPEIGAIIQDVMEPQNTKTNDDQTFRTWLATVIGDPLLELKMDRMDFEKLISNTLALGVDATRLLREVLGEDAAPKIMKEKLEEYLRPKDTVEKKLPIPLGMEYVALGTLSPDVDHFYAPSRTDYSPDNTRLWRRINDGAMTTVVVAGKGAGDKHQMGYTTGVYKVPSDTAKHIIAQSEQKVSAATGAAVAGLLKCGETMAVLKECATTSDVTKATKVFKEFGAWLAGKDPNKTDPKSRVETLVDELCVKPSSPATTADFDLSVRVPLSSILEGVGMFRDPADPEKLYLKVSKNMIGRPNQSPAVVIRGDGVGTFRYFDNDYEVLSDNHGGITPDIYRVGVKTSDEPTPVSQSKTESPSNDSDSQLTSTSNVLYGLPKLTHQIGQFEIVESPRIRRIDIQDRHKPGRTFVITDDELVVMDICATNSQSFRYDLETHALEKFIKVGEHSWTTDGLINQPLKRQGTFTKRPPLQINDGNSKVHSNDELYLVDAICTDGTILIDRPNCFIDWYKVVAYAVVAKVEGVIENNELTIHRTQRLNAKGEVIE